MPAACGGRNDTKLAPTMSRFGGCATDNNCSDFVANCRPMLGLSLSTSAPQLLPCSARLKRFWLGWLDSNQRMRESKSRALPLGYTPKW